MAFAFYTDSGLVNELVSNLIFTQPSDHSSLPGDQIIYLGSNDTDREIGADNDYGVDQIVVTPTDGDPGNNHEKEEITLSLDAAGLDVNVAGDPLNLGLTISSGVGFQVAVHIRVRDATSAIGVSTELSLQTNSLREIIV